MPPTWDDPVLRGACEAVGGPAGRRIRPGTSWWTPLRVLLAIGALVMALGVIERGPCRDAAWPRETALQYTHACYSDVPHLYRERGFVDGDRPYFDAGEHPPLEYPVLTGAFMWAGAQLSDSVSGPSANERAVRFYDVNALLFGVAALIAIAATVRLAGPRPWDAALFAAAPVLALSGTVNWDLIAVALVALGMLAWARGRPTGAGLWLGLAIAAKLYPVTLLLPLGLVCLRAGKMAEFRRTVLAAAAAWCAVNAPVYLAAPGAWEAFYTFNKDRGADFGSIWYVLEHWGRPVANLDLVVGALMVAVFAAIAVLALMARARPRVGQLAFLAVAAFIVLNKVWSPQYALWLLPLVALARPRWRDFLVWQAGEVVYFFCVWYYLAAGYDSSRGLPGDVYDVAVLLRLGGLLWLVAFVVRDILDPRCDPVRASGLDDPAGGVVDGAADRWARPAAGERAGRLDAVAPPGPRP